MAGDAVRVSWALAEVSIANNYEAGVANKTPTGVPGAYGPHGVRRGDGEDLADD